MDKIKTILLTAFALVVAMSVASCGDDDNPTVAPSATGTFEDTDGTLYHWVRVGSLDWMVENSAAARLGTTRAMWPTALKTISAWTTRMPKTPL